MNTPHHSYFNLKKGDKGQYIEGKKDLFATIIAIKYFVNKNTFNSFIDKLSNLIDESIKLINGITKKELLDFMNLPQNFTDIKKYNFRQ